MDTKLESYIALFVIVWSFVGVLAATTAIYHDFQNKRTEKIVFVLMGPIVWFLVFMVWLVGDGPWRLIDRKPKQ